MQTKLETTKINKDGFYIKYGKTILDITISTIALIILSPIFFVVSIFIKLDSKGPILYKQKRMGKDQKKFHCYKFRTMVINADKLGPTSTLPGDNRITKIGKVLRKTSTDELPQLINIIKGEMSLIGPRPDIYKENPSEYDINRTVVLPGITGLAQVNGRSNISLEDRIKYDIDYCDNISLKKDISIIIKTVSILLNFKSAY